MVSERRRKNLEALRLRPKIYTSDSGSGLQMKRRPTLEDRKAKFAAINEFVISAGGWLVSIPGEREVRLECLETSDLPQKLRDAGYELREDGEGQRIVPHAITERFTRGESTRPVVHRVTHAGLCKVLKFSFTIA
jgi:hypothetical protein